MILIISVQAVLDAPILESFHIDVEMQLSSSCEAKCIDQFTAEQLSPKCR